VSATLARDVFLEGLPIDVRVSDGVVSLSGRVGSAYESSRAARDARGVVNVRDVVNTLEVDLHELRGVRAKRPVPSDAELASAVHQELLEDLRIGVPIELKVSAHRGVVTLQGRVTTLHQRRLAERDARDVVGTVWVVDHLKVVAEDRPDAAIGDDVRAQIDGDWALHDAGIHVHVIGGVVTLTGRVDDRFRRGHAADLASRVPGVRAIENDLAVEPETVSDATVADRVRERLEADALTHWVADAVAVDVNAGVVTLRGRVDLFAEREEAGRVALRTRGVAGVENRLAVKDVDAPWSDPPKEDPTRAYGEGSEDLDFGMAWAAPVW
jgi:osmotically-inducible protein OsmY